MKNEGKLSGTAQMAGAEGGRKKELMQRVSLVGRTPEVGDA